MQDNLVAPLIRLFIGSISADWIALTLENILLE